MLDIPTQIRITLKDVATVCARLSNVRDLSVDDEFVMFSLYGTSYRVSSVLEAVCYSDFFKRWEIDTKYCERIEREIRFEFVNYMFEREIFVAY